MPSFLGYPHRQTTSRRRICASVNDEIVHGIPGPRRAATRATWSRSTAARSSTAGTATPRSRVGGRRGRRADQVELLGRDRGRRCGPGIAAAPVGGRLTDIGARRRGRSLRAARASYGIVEEYVGHGIGTEMHRTRRCPTTGAPGRGPRLVAGHGAGGRADGRPWARRQTRRAGRRLDRRHRGRQPGGPLRAHRRGHRRRAVGADRPRRRRAARLGALARSATPALPRARPPVSQRRPRRCRSIARLAPCRPGRACPRLARHRPVALSGAGRGRIDRDRSQAPGRPHP